MADIKKEIDSWKSKKNATFLRSCGLWLILGGVMTLVLGTSDLLFPTQSYAPGCTVQQILVAISHALVLIGLIGLTRSNAAGKSLIVKVGPISLTKTYYKKRKVITHV